ncbi:hypothetical protein BX666DRAFT_1881305 [Dichotomocladium elegans]|nr:hypothetical protein BX666DRAFT_1881305 [Dichotomocladium elegans]
MTTQTNPDPCQPSKSSRRESKRTERVPNQPVQVAGLMTPGSPPYPPYAGGFIDPAMYDHLLRTAAAASNTTAGGTCIEEQQPAGGSAHLQHQAQQHYHQAYVYSDLYPMSPQFQYYPDANSYPGSPAIHPQSPPVNPISPPFSPHLQYSNITLSPPIHAAYMIQPHFPPLHISSPILTGVASPSHHQYQHPLPAPLSLDKRRQSSQQPQQQSEDFQYHSLNVYVRGLAESVSDETFDELCKEFGNVMSSKAMIDQKTGLCKGYGFVMYEKEEEAEKAIIEMNKKGLQASFARVGQESFSSRLKSLQDETSTNIYVSNLPLDMTEQKLEALFLPYTTVSNRILRDPRSTISRGVGFARMSDRASAQAIIEKFNGRSIEGSSAPLQVRFADSPAQKKLKSQTARKRTFRSPRDFQSMSAGFQPSLPAPMAAAIAAAMSGNVRPMPITPETMLGMAPMMDTLYSQHVNSQSTTPAFVQNNPGAELHSNGRNSSDDDVKELVAETKQLNVSCG